MAQPEKASPPALKVAAVTTLRPVTLNGDTSSYWLPKKYDITRDDRGDITIAVRGGTRRLFIPKQLAIVELE